MSFLNKLFGMGIKTGNDAPARSRTIDQATGAPKPKASTADAEKLYQKGLKFATQENFRQAIPVLEEAAALNPLSAPIHQVLAFSYSQVAGAYAADKAAMNSWVDKAADTFWKACTLHREHGGLEPTQLKRAIEFVAAVDRITMAKSNTPTEDQRKQIFRRYQSAKHSGSSSFESVAVDMIRCDSVTDMFRTLQKHEKHDRGVGERAVDSVAAEFKITERQLQAIIQEAATKKW